MKKSLWLRSILVLVTLVVALPHQIYGFNWNRKTVRSMGGHRGKIEAPRESTLRFGLELHPGGHNFATRRALDYAILLAQKDSKMKSDVELVYGETLENLQMEYGFVFQKILWGNYSNEVQTMLDAVGGAEEVASKVVKAGYLPRRGIVGPGGRSIYWNENTGYTSSNVIHSMLVTSNDPVENADIYTQQYSLDKIKAFTLGKIRSVLLKLVNVAKAHRDGIYVIEESFKQSAIALMRGSRNLRKSYDGTNLHWLDSRYEYALRDLGSLFHTIQDSSVACTENARSAKVNPVTDCFPGDGHGIVEKNDGQWKVVSLSDGAWYARKDGKHAALDDLYVPGNVVPVQDLVEGKDIEHGVYGSFDPAIPTAMIFLEVAQEVRKINDLLADIQAYITLSEELVQGVRLKKLKEFEAYLRKKFSIKVAHEDSLTEVWKQKVPPLVEEAAVRIAQKYVFSRYADQLRPLPAPPTEVGGFKIHGDEHQ